ncbi:energy-coupling factor ABC transporter permease [Zoogloea sp.]|uniref:energy-coupling factor ABC transporter permease n=1 Tax=Zoogloea sp. TaxID=49181 RepID=UPI00260D3D44|nr:energy-coupling factor ABC transporter permease [Zoogloea sp.]MDD3353671.1 energy-coupling factor ABC transporter permease [Zoogloea sp.]
MNLASDLFSMAWHVFASLCGVGAGAWLYLKAPWRRLLDTQQLNAMAGAAVVLTVLWSMNAGVYPGLNLHLLGAMATTLIFGPQLALVVLALALAGITLNGSAEWSAYPINLLVMGIVPVAVATLYFRVMERFLPKHFFVYIFVNAFLGAAVTVLVQGLVATLSLLAAGAYPADKLLSEYLPFFLLLGFAEAWLSGMALTLLVIYRPEWVSTFDDRSYLINK